MTSDGLRLRHGDLLDRSEQIARDKLLFDVLGLPGPDAKEQTGPWRPFSLFNQNARCVANIDVALLPLMLDGAATEAAGLRSVAVDPAWRGRGLFRALMDEALAWCDVRTRGPVFLYTEDDGLYQRFGFTPLAQHAFHGAAPSPRGAPGVRALDIQDAADRATIRAQLARRIAVSSHCALTVDAPLYLANLGKDGGYLVAHATDLDALIVYETDEDTLVLADVVAAAIPDAAAILGALGLRPAKLQVLFPPDRLDWRGNAIREDTGLMVRGIVPAPLMRPFMFPPMVEF